MCKRLGNVLLRGCGVAMETGIFLNGGGFFMTTALFCSNRLRSGGVGPNQLCVWVYIPLMGMRLVWNGTSVSDSLLEGVAVEALTWWRSEE